MIARAGAETREETPEPGRARDLPLMWDIHSGGPGPGGGGGSSPDSLKEVREAAEKDHVVKVLGKCGWNISKAAQEMEINRPTLHDFWKKHNISNG